MEDLRIKGKRVFFFRGLLSAFKVDTSSSSNPSRSASFEKLLNITHQCVSVLVSPSTRLLIGGSKSFCKRQTIKQSRILLAPVCFLNLNLNQAWSRSLDASAEQPESVERRSASCHTARSRFWFRQFTVHIWTRMSFGPSDDQEVERRHAVDDIIRY